MAIKTYSEFDLIKNYIYLYHLDEFLILPVYPDQIADSLSSTFSSQNALSRTAPVFSYSYSGPRTVQVSLSLHRDMLYQVNIGNSNATLDIGEEYVDWLIRQLQTIALPKYNSSIKEVVPPMVALRFGDDVFIKGIVNGGISVEYHIPVIQNLEGNGAKYATVNISFTISEVDPYDAQTVSELGSFRGLTSAMTQNLNQHLRDKWGIK